VPAFFSFVHGWLEGRRKTVHAALAVGATDEFDEIPE
jgi:hypothetical protein